MLSKLYIENVAVIDKMTVDFRPGFSVLTGETGAGKSIIIDALNMVLGERASKDLIRTGNNSAFVSALFDMFSTDVITELSTYGIEIDENGELLIERQISTDGKNTCRINGRPVTTGILREIGKFLVNIHGQHDNQSLLDPEKHLSFLDRFAVTDELLSSFQDAYKNTGEIKKQINALKLDEHEKARRLDMLRYQINEINAASLKANEDIELGEQKKRVRNAEKISSALSMAYEMLYERDDSAAALIETSKNELSGIASFSREINDAYLKLGEISFELEEVTDTIRT
ncbi:MAG: AAA family ATPase, partial [Bacillota bacterium]|nr:AAA family ATPase [Bacillota bacterium]